MAKTSSGYVHLQAITTPQVSCCTLNTPNVLILCTDQLGQHSLSLNSFASMRRRWQIALQLSVHRRQASATSSTDEPLEHHLRTVDAVDHIPELVSSSVFFRWPEFPFSQYQSSSPDLDTPSPVLPAFPGGRTRHTCGTHERTVGESA